jgi:hypothetical protein
VIGTEPTDFSPAEERLSKEHRKRAQDRVANRRKYEVEIVRWEGQNAFTRAVAPGDQVIQLYDSGRSTRVLPPSRVLHRKHYQSFDGKKAARLLLYLEQDRTPKTMPVGKFRNALRRFGLSIPLSPCRELKSARIAGVALSFWT